MNEQLCERCGLYRRYQHLKTAKIFKLCANCGWEALTGRKDMIKRGTQIIYVPTHANGDIHHADCEAGFIASPTVLPGNAIFCRYWAKGSGPRRLRTLANSEATPIEYLVLRDTVPLQDVKVAIKIFLPERAKGMNNNFTLERRASEEMGCTCDACLNIIRKEIEDEG